MDIIISILAKKIDFKLADFKVCLEDGCRRLQQSKKQL